MFGKGKVKNIVSPSFIFLLIYLVLYLYGINWNLMLVFISILFLSFDISQLIKRFNIFDKSKNENYRNIDKKTQYCLEAIFQKSLTSYFQNSFPKKTIRKKFGKKYSFI